MQFKKMLNEDRGESLVGTAIALVLYAIGFALVIGAFTVNTVQTRTAINFGIATNEADAIIKDARVADWKDVGTSSPSNAGLLPSGYTPVSTGKFEPVKTSEQRGVPMTVKTSVGEAAPGGKSAKMVAVQVTWADVAGGEQHLVTQSTILSPPSNQTTPSSIPMLGE